MWITGSGRGRARTGGVGGREGGGRTGGRGRGSKGGLGGGGGSGGMVMGVTVVTVWMGIAASGTVPFLAGRP